MNISSCYAGYRAEACWLPDLLMWSGFNHIQEIPSNILPTAQCPKQRFRLCAKVAVS
jgi:hypothetical protein